MKLEGYFINISAKENSNTSMAETLGWSKISGRGVQIHQWRLFPTFYLIFIVVFHSKFSDVNEKKRSSPPCVIQGK